MVSLQDELAALASLDKDDDDASFLSPNAPARTLRTISSPSGHHAVQTRASELTSCAASQSRLILTDNAQRANHQPTLRLRTSFDHLKQGKRDTHSPDTLRKLLSEPSDYDGTEYGDPQDDSEPEETFPSLDAAIDTLQGCCSANDDTAGEADVICRFAKALSELRPQSAVETLASRCIAAHETLAAAMPRKVNGLRDLSMQVAAGYLSIEANHEEAAVQSDQKMLREALHALEEVSRALYLEGRPQTSESRQSETSSQASQWRQETAIDMLNQLQTDTSALLGDLSSLSDALSMLRQTSLSASRKLRTVRDQVDLMQKENRLAEHSRMLLEQDGWHAGGAQRIMARQCREICVGFEGTWQRLRGRLIATA